MIRPGIYLRFMRTLMAMTDWRTGPEIMRKSRVSRATFKRHRAMAAKLGVKIASETKGRGKGSAGFERRYKIIAWGPFNPEGIERLLERR
jgi:hypothetical protein